MGFLECERIQEMCQSVLTSEVYCVSRGEEGALVLMERNSVPSTVSSPYLHAPKLGHTSLFQIHSI